MSRAARLKSATTCLSAGFHPPAARSVSGYRLWKAKPKASAMTLERPMFPPRAEAKVIDFTNFKRPAPHQGAAQAFREAQDVRREAQLLQLNTPERLSSCALNLRLRLDRKDAWRAAARATRYWRACVDWCSALESGHRFNTGDAIAYAKPEPGRRGMLVQLWRVALVNQMLTPAPTQEAVEWKRAEFRRGQHQWVAVSSSAIEAAIQADVDWLKAHPTRRAKPSLVIA